MTKKQRPTTWQGDGAEKENGSVVEQPDLLSNSQPEQQVSLTAEKTADEHAEIISAAYQKGVAAFVETGKRLLVAKDELAEKEQWLPLLETMLPFGPRVGQRLMAIARNAVLANTSYQTFLPPHIDTLVRLAKLGDELGDSALLARLQDGRITPETTTKEVSAMLPRKPKQQTKKPSRDTKLAKELEATQAHVVELEASRPDTDELDRLREQVNQLEHENLTLKSEIEGLQAELAKQQALLPAE